MADIFSVIADPTRRQILSHLLDRYVGSDAPAATDNPTTAPMGEISVSDLVSKLVLSQPTVSKHLKVLRDAGLVTVREEGQHRFYALESSPLEEVEDWLIPFLSADFDDAMDQDSLDIEAELDELESQAEREQAAEQVSDGTPQMLKSQSSAARAGERLGYTVAGAAERARALFEEAARRIPSISRSSD
ncbi:metalloregulator ArsR/SmtB family transcription factor [Subtercola sp. PAMC28395]|uniref:ArsR/SmtB family transcription factor n=1 Tax=Subtercola sp. PAMC28395 TaxID=2846775 RepID=UPI001C0B8645|nr:metalloregulator ArsR/SmtB family transcription factor [Subtercola sp. PAMC28395]